MLLFIKPRLLTIFGWVLLITIELSHCSWFPLKFSWVLLTEFFQLQNATLKNCSWTTSHSVAIRLGKSYRQLVIGFISISTTLWLWSSVWYWYNTGIHQHYAYHNKPFQLTQSLFWLLAHWSEEVIKITINIQSKRWLP